jgi:hypothetical protein
MSDALEIFRAARATPPAPVSSLQASGYQVNTVSGSRDLHDLAMVPGSPGYNARIPKPPCVRCGEDHFPGREYDHEWQAELVVHDEPVSATVRRVTPQATTVVEVAHTSQFRVGLYVGRGDAYVVSVEAAPDWDSTITFKVDADDVLPLIWLARALGVKIADKTGGDLLMLEEDYARQYAQDHGRGAARAGSDQPRRPGPEPAGDAARLEAGDGPPPAVDAV